MHFYMKILVKILFHRRGISKKHFRKAFPYGKMPMKKWSLAGEAFSKAIFEIDSPYEKCLSKNCHSPGKHFRKAFWIGILMKMLGIEIAINGQMVKITKYYQNYNFHNRHFWL